MLLGVNGKRPRGVILPCFFTMTHIDGVTQNNQLVSSLLYFYWLTTSEYPCLLKASTILLTAFRILLDVMANNNGMFNYFNIRDRNFSTFGRGGTWP